MKELYDPSIDNASEGKCCTRLRIVNYPPVKCEGCTAKLEATKRQLDANPFLARFCIEIDIFGSIYWRICHRDKDHITRLQLSLVRGALMAIKPDLSPAILSN